MGIQENYLKSWQNKTLDELKGIRKLTINNHTLREPIKDVQLSVLDRLITEKKTTIREITIEESREVNEDENQPEQSEIITYNDFYIASRYVAKVKSSKSRGIDFDLSFSEFKRILKRKRCYYFDIKLSSDKNSPYRKTLDRIDNSKGYTVENTVLCSWQANQIKNELFELPSGNLRIDFNHMLKMMIRLRDAGFNTKNNAN